MSSFLSFFRRSINPLTFCWTLASFSGPVYMVGFNRVSSFSIRGKHGNISMVENCVSFMLYTGDSLSRDRLARRRELDKLTCRTVYVLFLVHSTASSSAIPLMYNLVECCFSGCRRGHTECQLEETYGESFVVTSSNSSGGSSNSFSEFSS